MIHWQIKNTKSGMLVGGGFWVTDASLVARNETRSLSKQTWGELATKSEGGCHGNRRKRVIDGKATPEAKRVKAWEVQSFNVCFHMDWGAGKSCLAAFYLLPAIRDHLSRVLIFNFQLLENRFAANGGGKFQLKVWGFIEKGWCYLQAGFK